MTLAALAQLVLPPGLFAGVIAVGVTVIIERWGGRVGGTIGTLPTTIVPAALGIAAELRDPRAFSAAIATAPVGILLNALFLLLWRVLPAHLPARSLARKLVLMIAISLLAWALAAAGSLLAIDRYRAAGGAVVLLGLGAAIAQGLLGLVACLRDVPAPRGRNAVGAVTLLLRGLLAATAVGLSAWLATTRVEIAAGMASVFPAIFLTTMVSLWLAQGEAVPAGAVGPMMLGSTSVSTFCLLTTLTYPAFGAPLGTVIAWIAAAIGVTLPVSFGLQRLARGRAAAAQRGGRTKVSES